MSVSAPGKLVLLGEYAVLEGGVAVVAAIDRRASGSLLPAGAEAPAPSPLVAALVTEAEHRGVLAPAARGASLSLDTSSFRDASGAKLGLGSSSAAAVVGAALLTDRGDEVVLDLALAAHRAASGGEGSGIDVAAAYYGGVLATKRQPAAVEPLASRMGGLSLGVLYTGRSASTADMIARVRSAPRFGEYVRVMTGLAEEGLRAFERQTADGLLSVVARYGRAMAGLGRDAGAPIVTDELEAIMRLADESRVAAAKPSGAGGGDVAIILAKDPELPRRIAERTSTTCLEVAVDRRGLSRR